MHEHIKTNFPLDQHKRRGRPTGRQSIIIGEPVSAQASDAQRAESIQIASKNLGHRVDRAIIASAKRERITAQDVKDWLGWV